MLASDSDAKLDLELEEFEEIELIEMLEMESKISSSLESCTNLLFIGNILLAILIGVICALIFSRFLDVKH